MTFGRWFAAALAGSALAWSGPVYAQASKPSAFSETYGNWTVRCAVGQPQEGGEGAEGQRQCVMEQRFFWQDAESGRTQPLLTVTLAPSFADRPSPADGGMEAIVLTPFGLRFDSGLRLRADEARSVVLSFETCFTDGCIARGPLDENAVESFRDGVVLYVEAEPAAGGDSFRLEGSLTGFTDANERLQEEFDRGG